MKQFIKKHDFEIVMFFVVSFALVLIFTAVFAQMAGSWGVSQEVGKIVIYSCYIYINIAMLAPLVICEI